MTVKNVPGVAAHAAPIGWVHLPGGATAPEAYTIRWRRGEGIAYVLPGKQLYSHALTGVLATVSVPQHGWIDVEHIRGHGRRWLEQTRRR